MSSTPANQDPALAPPAAAAPPPAGAPSTDSAAAIGPPLDGAQIVQILRHFPNVYHVGLLPSSFPFLPSLLLRALGSERRGIISVGCALPRDSGGGSRLGHVRVSVRCRLSSGRCCVHTFQNVCVGGGHRRPVPLKKIISPIMLCVEKGGKISGGRNQQCIHQRHQTPTLSHSFPAFYIVACGC